MTATATTTLFQHPREQELFLLATDALTEAQDEVRRLQALVAELQADIRVLVKFVPVVQGQPRTVENGHD